MASFTYGGDELDIFSHAVSWKQYLRRVKVEGELKAMTWLIQQRPGAD